jgi:hypothetical protein
MKQNKQNILDQNIAIEIIERIIYSAFKLMLYNNYYLPCNNNYKPWLIDVQQRLATFELKLKTDLSKVENKFEIEILNTHSKLLLNLNEKRTELCNDDDPTLDDIFGIGYYNQLKIYFMTFYNSVNSGNILLEDIYSAAISNNGSLLKKIYDKICIEDLAKWEEFMKNYKEEWGEDAYLDLEITSQRSSKEWNEFKENFKKKWGEDLFSDEKMYSSKSFNETDYYYGDNARYCPRCNETPCMCSDPDPG